MGARMCRFVAYHGTPVRLSTLLYEPEHSIIHQSVHAHEREEPLNGDGWGVGWYAPGITEQPALYRTIHPAWSDENMRHVSPLVETPTFLAHVRAATEGLAVQQLNCHPFRGGQHSHDRPDEFSDLQRARQRLLLMHNGSIGAYKTIIRRLKDELDDDLYFSIRGSTDSEHTFALIQDHLGAAALDPSPRELSQAIAGALGELNEMKAEAGRPQAETQANLCLTDGRSMVATRYVHPHDGTANSLYVGQAEAFTCEAGRFSAEGPEGSGTVLIASERLWDDDRVWEKVPQNHAVLVEADGSVTIEAMDVAG